MQIVFWENKKKTNSKCRLLKFLPRVLIIKLNAIDAIKGPEYSTIFPSFYKGDNFCDFLFAFLYIKSLLGRRLILNQICSKRNDTHTKLKTAEVSRFLGKTS